MTVESSVIIHPHGVKRMHHTVSTGDKSKGNRVNKSLSAVFGRLLKSLHLPCLPLSQYVVDVAKCHDSISPTLTDILQ